MESNRKDMGTRRAAWSFWESPLTWGGIGFLFGASLLSNAWFQYTFFGAGMAIGIAALRAGFFRYCSAAYKWPASLLMLSAFTILWVVLWRVVPRPAEPLTDAELREVVREELTRVGELTDGMKERHDTDSAARAEIGKIIRQALVESVRRNQAPADIHRALIVSHATIPSIVSAPAMFHDGQISGRDFGSLPGRIYLHPRVRPSAQRGEYSSGTIDGPGPERLFGTLDGVNFYLLGADVAQQWSDRCIRLKFPKGFWNNSMATIQSVAQKRGIPPPESLDLQVGYIVETADGRKSGLFYSD